MRTLSFFPSLTFAIAFALSGEVALAQESAAPDPNQPLEASAAEPASTDVDVDPSRLLDEYEASEQISEDLSVAFPVDI